MTILMNFIVVIIFVLIPNKKISLQGFPKSDFEIHIKKDNILPNASFDEKPSNLFTILPELYKFKYGKETIIYCHYPLEQWEDMDRGAIHIHGHTHHTLDNSEINKKYRRIDVGWTIEKPVYLLDDIILQMKNRDIKEHYGNNIVL